MLLRGGLLFSVCCAAPTTAVLCSVIATVIVYAGRIWFSFAAMPLCAVYRGMSRPDSRLAGDVWLRCWNLRHGRG